MNRERKWNKNTWVVFCWQICEFTRRLSISLLEDTAETEEPEGESTCEAEGLCVDGDEFTGARLIGEDGATVAA